MLQRLIKFLSSTWKKHMHLEEINLLYSSNGGYTSASELLAILLFI